jgi:hypothetical protein
LDKEKAKLNHLVDEAIKNGLPVSGNPEILEQSRKVDALIEKIQKEKADRNRDEPSK